MKNRTTVEPKSELELVVTRTFNGPARIVFEAWTKPEMLKRWWAPSRRACPCFPAKRMFVSAPISRLSRRFTTESMNPMDPSRMFAVSGIPRQRRQ